MKSIRAELVSSAVIVLAAVLLLAELATYWAVERSLQAQFDSFLEQELDLLTNLVEFGPQGLLFDSEPINPSQFEPGEGTAYLDVAVEGDSTLFRSPNLGTHRLGGEAAAEPDFWFETIDEEQVRFVAVAIAPQVELDDFEEVGMRWNGRELPMVEVRLGRRDEFRGPFLAGFRLAAIGMGLVAMALAALVSSLLARRALLELDKVAAEIADVPVDGSAGPLQPRDLPDELAPIVTRLNALLERISAAVKRERGLIADIAHELRTPIAALKTNFEVTMQRERDAAAYKASLISALAILDRSERMIVRLLELQRMEAGEIELEQQSFDLAQVVTEQLALQAPTIAARQLRLEVALPPQLILRSEPTLWRLIVSNLVDNLVTYAAPARRASIRLLTHSPMLEFECRNPGSTVDTARARQLLERFVRADSSRDASGNHVGLGLTLVRQACSTLGLELSLTAEVGGDFCVRIRGPVAAPR